MDILHLLFKRIAQSRPGVLHPGVPIRLLLACTTGLCLLRGRVWITIEGEPQDWFAGAGEALTLPPGRLIVIECDSAEPARLHWTEGFELSAERVRAVASR